MSNQTYGTGGSDDRVSEGRGSISPIVFVSDPAEESSRVADRLRAAGYVVVDVPLSMLVARAEVQRPDVVMIDIDASSALEEVAAFRSLPSGAATSFVYIGSGSGPNRAAADALRGESGVFFGRPIDVRSLVDHVAELTGGPRPRSDRSSPPPSQASSRPPSRVGSAPPDRPSAPALPSPGVRLSAPPLPLSVPSLAELGESPPRSLSAFGGVSSELSQLLADAEVRAEAMLRAEAHLPSPEEEIESVLPADVLASLDEPLEGDEGDEPEPRVSIDAHERDIPASQGKSTTSGGKLTTASGRVTSASVFPRERRPGVEAQGVGRGGARDESELAADRRKTGEWNPPPQTRASWQPAPIVSTDVAPAAHFVPDSEPELDALDLLSPGSVPPEPPVSSQAPRPSQAPMRGPSEAPARASVASAVLLRPLDSRRFFAEAIASRRTGSLCFEHEGVVRRVVLRDGDLVTAASGAENESLVAFLGARGDLPRDEVDRLSGKIPPYGRHAGAALVAHGWLGQDQLWSALRAHAEWIAATVLGLVGATAQLELEPPGRLRSEPSVFAAKAGAEIFIELVRRVVSPEEALEALGGEASRIGDGVVPTLIGECGLAAQELELVARSRGGTVGELAARSPQAEIVAVVHGLQLLGVLDVIFAIEPGRDTGASASTLDAEAAALDEEALRARVRARLELVDEGDYFSLLGVGRDATSYEVRRAFIELRRTFEPSRILTARTLDLADDVRKIVVVLEEAYEVLRDTARRERYRRAIDARPD